MDSKSTVTSLKAASVVVIGFGVLSVAAAVPSLNWPMRLLVDFAFWPIDGQQTLASPDSRLLCAIGGGLTVGLGVMIWTIAERLFPREPDLARSMILSGMGTWFAFDSAGSVLAGAPLNAVLNVGFLLLFVLPLWRAQGTAPATTHRS